ncbi:hypothetical protein O7623_09195 [Solwaraspora sp. WMMD791]|uniref:hypothetical protein n=1 Tax=Solwaraspora sp. WMMD791 TaxID=3016086 RepID=UPI00249C4C6C|nr:hypothetical protein [Solwaraspora sp. WMMD791]WFE29344.1 hypothetical protein O7623_09195 [Solwaraspora sp. WMMD791]
MQPMATPQPSGAVESGDAAPAPVPVHGRPIPAPRPMAAGHVINEATTEMPVIAPPSADRQNPSPLPPIATQLLGGTPTDERESDEVPSATAQGPTDTAPESPGHKPADAASAAHVADTSLPADTDSPADSDSDDSSDSSDGPAGDNATATQPEPAAEAEPAGSADDADPHDADDPAEDDDDPEAVTAHGDAGDLSFDDDDLEDEDDEDEEDDDLEDDDDDEEDDLDDDDDDGDEDDDEDEEPADLLTSVDDAQPEAVSARRPGDVSLPPITIWTEAAADDLRDEWHEIKARFVDEPDVALAQAQALVGHTVRTLAERLLAEQNELDPHRHSETPDTESMRVALRQYREFLDRLLAI